LYAAWAGGTTAGEKVRSELIALTGAGLQPQEAFDEAIAKLDIAEQQSLAVIAVCFPVSWDADVPQCDQIQVFTHQCIEFKSTLWGTCYFGGSGGQALRVESAASIS
jgi:hypothetical protein